MEKPSPNSLSSHTLYLVFLLLALSPLESLARRGGFLNFQFLCFQNPGHFDFEGYVCDSIPSKNCDPFFSICISNKPINGESHASCPIYFVNTEPYHNQESVCNTPYENRGSLANIVLLELPFPIQEMYYVQIIVRDYNQFSAHQYIAVFSTSFAGIPSFNNGAFRNTEISMTRNEVKVRNPNVMMKISMGLQCDSNLYDRHCSTFCRSIPTDNYICSSSGKKVCNPGWKGEICSEKDLCHNFKCAEGASCVLKDSSPKCLCNGIIGPQCYPNYNPCKPNPCKNEGTCLYTNNGVFSCKCIQPFYGSHCELKIDLCQLVPCHNNGTCVMTLNGDRLCKCLSGFEGSLCDKRVLSTAAYNKNTSTDNMMAVSGLKTKQTINFALVFGAVVTLCVLVVITVGGYFFMIRKNKRKGIITRQNPMYMKDLSKNCAPPCAPNDYGIQKDDTVYDTIDERETYVFQREENDDYLVPSRPTTPAMTPGNISDSSDYVPMFNTDSMCTEEEITNINTKENEYLPPLPTRTPTKKHFKMFQNFKF